MTDKVTDDIDNEEMNAPDKVAIEEKLPLTAIDIESQKDIEAARCHPLRSFQKWFAARPTPVARLAIIASVYPGKIDPDELLQLMQIGPKEIDSNISNYVEKKFAEKNSSGTLDEHYTYPNPNTQSPSKAELHELHKIVRDGWGGELPTILDPTAGRGIIPFESIRYEFPVKANELNPVPTLIMKAVLKYAPQVGSLEPEVYEWRDKIHEIAKENIAKYYPTKKPGREILNCAFTYLIKCDSCKGEVPLTGKWWLNKTTDGGDAVRPIYQDGTVEYEHIKVENIQDSEYDVNEGPVTRGDAECPHCGVVTKSDKIREKIRNGNFEYSIYGVNYKNTKGERVFRAGSEVDKEGMNKAAERLRSDFEMMDFLTEPIEEGLNTNQIRKYGMNEWRDTFTPRQLVTHYEYLQAFNKCKTKIKTEYSKEKSDAILTLLTFSASRVMTFNSRLAAWRDAYGNGAYIFSDNNYSIKKMAVDNNISAPRHGYVGQSDRVLDAYQELSRFVENSESNEVEVLSGDAANLTEDVESGSINAAIVDPPYYSSIMYGELSEIFYVLQKEYIQDVHPDLFDSKLPNKDDEAVANPSRFSSVSGSEKSGKELANEFYEQKMQDIFSEIHNLLDSDGIITIMFTHRDMDAWDTLTSALIEANFTITATHPIKTEMSDRVGLQGKASADSSILLVGRKRDDNTSKSTSLWDDIKSDIETVAKREAKDIFDSGYTISKTDTAIAAYGPTLHRYAEEHPVVDKKGDEIRPRKALSEAREAVTSVIAERFLNTEGVSELDSLTRWYILTWLIYENDTVPYDEGRQLGVAAGVDIDDIKRPTKIWGKSRGDIRLKNTDDRVQDVVMLRNDSVDNPSSRKYPVNPNDYRFTYTIDTVHAALHVYEREGAEAAWDWLTERNLKSDDAFAVSVTALIEVLPEEESMHGTLVNLISGETGEYLDINVDHIDMSGVDRQTSLGDHKE
jgi:adenine-specific DNA methylase